jgi:hypothetical protein
MHVIVVKYMSNNQLFKMGSGLSFKPHFQQYFIYRSSQFYWWRKHEYSGENHRHAACHLQTLSHNVVSGKPRHERGLNSQL